MNDLPDSLGIAGFMDRTSEPHTLSFTLPDDEALVEGFAKHMDAAKEAFLREQAGKQRYVALVVDEPLPGFPSHRLYGPFNTSDEAVAALGAHPLPDYVSKGVFLLRGPEEIAKEVIPGG